MRALEWWLRVLIPHPDGHETEATDADEMGGSLDDKLVSADAFEMSGTHRTALRLRRLPVPD